jgi:hypothetical protein
VNFLMLTIIDIHQLNLGPFGSFKILVENSLKICVFFLIFSNNKGKIFYVFTKTNQYQMKYKKIL